MTQNRVAKTIGEVRLIWIRFYTSDEVVETHEHANDATTEINDV